MNESSLGSPITIRAPSRARMMSSIPCLSGVPGAILAIALRRIGSIRGSSSAALRGKPSGAAGLRCFSVLGSVAIQPRPDRASQCLGLENAYFATRGAGGSDNLSEPELRALLQTAVGLRGGAQATRQADLAEGGRAVLHGRTAGRRRDRERHREVRARLVDAKPPRPRDGNRPRPPSRAG